MGSRFIRPETVTVTVSGGDTITLRRRLTAGEQRAMFAGMYAAGADGQLRTIPFAVGPAVVVAYLLDWTLQDDAGRRVPIAGLSAGDLGAVLDGLDPAFFAELRAAVEGHVVTMDAERAAEKKTIPPGGSAS